MFRKICPLCAMARSGRGAAWIVLLAASLVFPWLTGCEKGPPKFKDLIGQGDEEKKEAPAPAPTPAPKVEPPKMAAQPAPPPKKRTSQEVLGDFNRTKPHERSDALLAELAQVEDGLDQITNMDLRRSTVTDTGLKHLEKMENITQLNLGSVGFSNAGLASVAKMKNVEELSLEATPIGSHQGSNDPNVRFLDAGLAQIKTMPKLRVLRLSFSKFTDKGLEEIAQMKDLEALYLSTTSVGDENIAQLKGLTNLRILELRETRITDNCFESLLAFKELEWLDIGANKERIKGTGMLEARKRKGLDKIKHLSVADTRWGDAGMEAIKRTNTLEYLDLGDTPIVDRNLECVKPNRKLQKIYLHRLNGISSDGLANLSPLKELIWINLDRTRGVRDPGLAHLKGLKKLERLVITETGCTEQGAKALKKFLPDVKITLKPGAPEL